MKNYAKFAPNILGKDMSTQPKSKFILGTTKGDNLLNHRSDVTISGGTGNDTIYGGSGNDSILGNAGNDKLRGDNGKDTLLGGNGNDYLSGDAGNDKLFGGAGNYILVGGKGNDSLWSSGGKDFIYKPGEGTDRTFDYGSGDMLKILKADGTSGGSYTKATFSGGNLTLAINGGGSVIFSGVSAGDKININGTTRTISGNTLK